jgi:putative salt-induced outer membrane protein YdiY
MKKSKAILFLSAAIFISACASIKSTEKLQMKNGDRLTGEVVRMEEDLLILKTDVSEDKLNIEWNRIECIESGRDLTVVLKDYETIVGRITCPTPGKLQVISPKLGPTRELNPDDILSINPGTYKGYLNAGGSLARGNSDTTAANLSTRFIVKTHRHRMTVEGAFNYAEADGTTNTRNSLGSIKYDFFQTEKIYNYAQVLTEQDTFANLNLRLTEGLGIGYQFSDRRKLRLSVETGISYYNEYRVVGNDTKSAAGRWAVNLEYETTPKWLQVYHRQEGYYTTESSSVSFRAIQGFRIPVRDQFGMFFESDYRFNSNPEAGKDKSDILLTIGISYEYAYW